MLPIKSELCSVKSFSIHSNGSFIGHSEVFQELKISDELVFGIENTHYNDEDDFGIATTYPDGLSGDDFINSKVIKVCLTSDNGWRHTDDDQVIHIAVHTTSGIFKVAMYHCHCGGSPLRKAVLTSPNLMFTDYL